MKAESENELIPNDATVIAQTVDWIKAVVIGCHFCPFAAKAMLMKSIRYVVLKDANTEAALNMLQGEMKFLDQKDHLETTLIILPNGFDSFHHYLQLVSKAESFVKANGYEGIYQIASFHPEYQFAESLPDDAANYTNRSVYPLLHILREESISKAVQNYANADQIPAVNIKFARDKGLLYMQSLLASIKS